MVSIYNYKNIKAENASLLSEERKQASQIFFKQLFSLFVKHLRFMAFRCFHKLDQIKPDFQGLGLSILLPFFHKLICSVHHNKRLVFMKLCKTLSLNIVIDKIKHDQKSMSSTRRWAREDCMFFNPFYKKSFRQFFRVQFLLQNALIELGLHNLLFESTFYIM